MLLRNKLSLIFLRQGNWVRDIVALPSFEIYHTRGGVSMASISEESLIEALAFPPTVLKDSRIFVNYKKQHPQFEIPNTTPAHKHLPSCI